MSIIKAILVLVFWKNPTDKSAWIKIGTAIRLGYQIGLHTDAVKGAGAFEALTAEAQDARRTWYCEFSEVLELTAGLSCESSLCVPDMLTTVQVQTRRKSTMSSGLMSGILNYSAYQYQSHRSTAWK